MPFRCAAASLGRDEPVLGTASTVRAFLLVEHAGSWGTEALVDSRLPEEVKADLRDRSATTGVRTLLIRRHRRTPTGEGLRVFAAYADPAAPWLETTTVPDHDALRGLDLAALGSGRSPGLTRTSEPVFCVCTHGRHDACCAEQGRPTAAALAAAHPEHTWEVSHIGGDRFAANVLVLPDGLYYGRVGVDDAARLGHTHRSGHLDLDRLRGRSGFGFAVQVAEVAVRREVGETRTDAVRLVSARGAASDISVVLAVAGTPYEIRVRRTETASRQQLTCRALRENRAPVWEVEAVRPLGPGNS